MSLINPNTVVTEERLNDFYKGILPYLGGMPEMLANKFSKGDLYSTDEKMIGQWTDGKPLYQKVVTATLGASSTTIDVSSLDIETFCFSKGMIDNGSTMIPIPYVNDTMYYIAVNYYSITNDTITIVSKNMENATVHIAIQYTKSTDVAISIGEATEYSTDEKVVGTWIDGKPIYQRTYSLNTDLPSSSGNPRSINITIDGLSSIGIDNVVSTSIIAKGKDNYAGSYLTSSCGQNLNSYLDVSNNRLQVYQLQTVDANQFTVKAFTIQYTKTT